MESNKKRTTCHVFVARYFSGKLNKINRLYTTYDKKV